MSGGTFYGVGVGPGDPELITRKAERVLRTVDWVYLPGSRRGGDSFARRIVEPLGLPEAKFRPVLLNMSPDRSADSEAYAGAAAEIAAELRAGRSVAWVTEGDPSFFSTFLHAREALAAYPGLRVEVVPGVTSPSAAAARLGWPAARLGERVAVVPAAHGVGRLPELCDEFATVFLLKVRGAFDELLAALRGLPGVRAAYLERLGTPAERVVTELESLRGRELPYFSLVMLRREEGA